MAGEMVEGGYDEGLQSHGWHGEGRKGQLFTLQMIEWCLWSKVQSKQKDTANLWSPCQKLLCLLKV